MFLLDTNTLIYYFRGKGSVSAHLLAAPPSKLAVSSITVFEIETGLRKLAGARTRRNQFTAFVQTVTVWDFDQAAATAAAEIRAALELKGQPIGPLDNLIAGIALSRNATLITRNLSEFGRVPGLKVTDWHG